MNIKAQEAEIRELIQTKAEVEERLSQIKAKILEDMTAKNVKLWATDTMRLTRKLPTTLIIRSGKFKKDHPESELRRLHEGNPKCQAVY